MLELRLKLLLFLLLMASLINVKSFNTHEFELPERCQYLKETKEMLHQMCKGKFPLVAYTKFRDTFMKKDDRMALFMPDSLDYVMVALKESELHRCESIQLLELKEYICYDADGGKRTIKFRDVRMYCFPFHIQITDDLTHECVLERDGDADSKLESDVLKTKRGIIHYIFDNDATGRLMPHQRVVIVFMVFVALARQL